MTATETFPADADLHMSDHCEHCNDVTCASAPCPPQWVEKRRANRRGLPSQLPQPVRW